MSLSICQSNLLFAQWVNLNTGIDDDLTGIVFWGDNGVVSGSKGIYYTTNGGNGSANWSRFNISSNQADSILYNNTKFNHIYAYFDVNTENNTAYACGKDTVNNQAVIMKFNLPQMTYSILYIGAPNSALNNIGYHGYGNTDRYYAVGDNGLIVTFTNTSATATNVVTSLTQKLTSISFLSNSVAIGAIEYRIVGTISSQIFTLTEIFEPGKEFLDVHKPFTSSANAVGTDFYRAIGTGNLITETNYDYGDLNGKALTYKNSDYYVGTDHGIFKEVDNYYRLEWQPSSMNYTINEFWFVFANQTNFYACGNDGVVLLTTNNGGPTKPYATISTSGTCVGNGSVYLYADSGSGTQCSWNINGSSAGSNCSSILYSTAVAGAFPVTLITSNGTFSDTATTTLFIVNPPQFNLPYTVADTVLCNAEPIEITIQNTGQNVYYSLHKYGSSQYLGSSPITNGGTITFQSSTITSSGYYYLRANSSLTSCNQNFTDSIYILVEKTNADFHVGLINADLNEATPFYEQTTEAQTFEWTFVNQNDTVYSALANPSILFSNLGSTLVKLKCWSGLGCSDSIQKMGPQIIDESSFTDSCWVNIHQNNWTNNQQYQGVVPIFDMERVSDGFVSCGHYENNIFPSQTGNTASFSTWGGYLNKYSSNGILKWSIRCDNSTINSNAYIYISSVVEDNQGNIICVGVGSPNTLSNFIIDNRGDTINYAWNTKSFLIKFNANGECLWIVNTNKFTCNQVYVDNEDNIYAYGFTGQQGLSQPGAFYSYLNGVLQDTLFENYPVFYAGANLNGLIKFSPLGTHSWSFPMYFDGANDRGVNGITFDSLNNVYISGILELGLLLHEATNTTITNFDAYGTNNYNNTGFITKYNDLGERIWFTSCPPVQNSSSGIQFNKVLTDSAGNSYFTGININEFAGLISGNNWIFVNADSSTNVAYLPGYFVGKINSAGFLEWANGLSFSQLPSQYYNLGVGYQLALKNDELSVLGIFSPSPANEFKFHGSNNTVIDVPIESNHYCIISYDTSGTIIKALTSDVPDGILLSYSSNTYGGFFIEDNSYYVARNIGFIGNQAPYYEFGSQIPPTSHNGWVNKFKEECGYLYMPHIEVTIDQYICFGSDLVLESGQVIANITQDTLMVDSLTTASGMDSVVIMNVWVVPQMSIQTYENVCYGSLYTFNDGFTLNQIMNNVSHTIQYTSVINGCDSLVTHNLSVLPSDTVSINLDICQDSIYIFPDGTSSTVSNSPVSNYSTLISVNGCDSVILTTLYPVVIDTVSINIDICQDSIYIFPDGTSSTVSNSPVSNYSTLISVNGCDSVILTTLYPVGINTDIAVNNGVIQASQTLGTFQWLDCNSGFAPIAGETLSSFAPLIDGNYAVAITYNGCIEYSDCESITGLSVDNLTTPEGIILFPNPTTGELTIVLDTPIKATSIRLFNLAGSILPVQNNQILDQKIHLNLSFDAGVYFIELINDNNVTHRLKVVKN